MPQNPPPLSGPVLDTCAESWGRTVEALGSRLGGAEIDGWLGGCSLLSLAGGVATLSAPTRLHADRLKTLYEPLICEALPASRIEIEIRPVAMAPPPTEAPPLAPEPVVTAARPPLVDKGEDPLLLNPDYTFENFVVGPCNRFAHAAARGVADRPAAAFNPLFLYGSVGLGKTHLVQAVAHELARSKAPSRILYLSCEQFVNHFIAALQQGDLNAFRNRYRHVDVLIVDDIQVLANKTRTQEEFFHTFNTLHNARKQIVLSCDAPPEDIPSLQDRLISRFQWGLVAEVEPPCFETRVAILHAKAERMGLSIPEDVAHLVAEVVEDNVRELEGSLTRVQAMAALTGRPITVDLAREILGPRLHAKAKIIRIEDVVDAVCRRFEVRLAELQSRRRTHSIVFPRQIAMWLIRRLTSFSLEEIGSFFGGRDHSTVVYALGKISSRRRVDGEFNLLLEDLERDSRAVSGSRG